MITYFCRGHGFGHASRSLRLVQELHRRGQEVTVVTYGYGAQYFRLMRVACIEVDIEDRRDFSPDAVRAFAEALPPLSGSDLFVVDELHYLPNLIRETSAAPIVVLTDWLFAERDLGVDTLLYPARRTFVVDFEHAHDLDDFTASRVEFVGPIAPIEPSTRTPAVHDNGRSIVVTVGGSASSPASLRLLQTMIPLLLSWARSDDEILVLGDDPAQGALQDPRVTWAGLRSDATALLRSADLVVCDGNGMTTCELAYLGVPTIAYLAPARSGMHDPVSARRVSLLADRAPFAVAEPGLTTADLGRLIDHVWRSDGSRRLPELRALFVSPSELVDSILEDAGAAREVLPMKGGEYI